MNFDELHDEIMFNLYDEYLIEIADEIEHGLYGGYVGEAEDKDNGDDIDMLGGFREWNHGGRIPKKDDKGSGKSGKKNFKD